MEAQRVRAPKPFTDLQKPLRSETSHWVDYRHCLPPENPAGHRKANRRIAKVHYSHEYPQFGLDHLQGRKYMNLYRHNSNAPWSEQGTSVP